MDKWTEIRSAYLVAKLGTVSAAADVLGVHRATVNRHIDALEQNFGSKFFQRHARGYTPTDAGRDMLKTTERVEEIFESLLGRTRGRSNQLSGDLLITSLSGIASFIMPAITSFSEAYPEVNLHYIADTRLARLEVGEAHIAIRAGSRPEELDYVVTPYKQIRFAPYAHKHYIAKHGKPDCANDLENHKIIGSMNDALPIPFMKWIRGNISPEQLVLHAEHPRVIFDAVKSGLGIGMIAEHDAEYIDDLVQIAPPQEEWMSNLWIVTHVDLHRTLKVQEFLKFLKTT